MANAQKPDFVFRRNGRVHLNRRGRQFIRLLAAELCVSAVVTIEMLDTPCSEVVWRVLATTPFASFPFTSLPVRHGVPSHFNWTLPGMSPGGGGDRCIRLITSPPSCADCLEILGASNSWNPQGLPRPVKGLLHLLLDICPSFQFRVPYSLYKRDASCYRYFLNVFPSVGGAVSLRCPISSHLLLPLSPLPRPATHVIYVPATSTIHVGPASTTDVRNFIDLTPLPRKQVWWYEKLHSRNPTYLPSSFNFLTALKFHILFLFLMLQVHLKL
jgi:hypothetical protein